VAGPSDDPPVEEELQDLVRELEVDRPALAERLERLVHRVRETPHGSPEYVSTGEAARALGVSPNTVKKWVRLGVISDAWALPGSGHIKIGRAEVDRLRQEGAHQPKSDAS
jgi:excisionase family DNA binding protein